MILYAVHPPTSECQGEGEDTREWFGNRPDARRRFREIVREIKLRRRLAERVAELNRPPYTDRRERLYEEARKQLQESVLPYRHDGVYLERYDVPTTKRELIAALDLGLYGCRKVLEKYPEEDDGPEA